MKKAFLLLIGIFGFISLYSQNQEIKRLTPTQIDSLFLERNLQLIAEQYNINIADAMISQAKLWNNPSLSLTQVNLWSTNSQREGAEEIIPPLFGSFGKNTEFSVELSQLIQTAGKRRKLINREKISKEIAIQEFEELMRSLKIELRNTIHEINYLQSYKDILDNQINTLDKLLDSYLKQVRQGNINKSEALRLQSSIFELENELNETSEKLNEQQRILKSLLYFDSMVFIEIEDEESIIKNPEVIVLEELLRSAIESRADLKIYQLQEQFHEKSLKYEKAQRFPDIELSANYDRFGGVWKDFIGFGIGFDLPVINRNQGNIKGARYELEKNKNLLLQQENLIRQEVAEKYANYLIAYNFYEKIKENNLLSEIDGMIEIYSRNLLNKNISMLEYIDFIESYKTTKETALNTRKKLFIQFEELQFVIGTEIN